MIDEDRGAGGPQPGDLGARARRRHFERLLGDDVALRLAEADLEPVEQVLAVVVVLVDDADLGVGVVLPDVAAVDEPLADVVREPRGRVRVLLPVTCERLRARGREEVRNLGGVEVRPDREAHLGAERADDREHFVLLHEPARQLDALSRVVGVVVIDPLDLPAGDAALAVRALRRVDIAEVRLHRRRDHAVRGRRAGERERAADRDVLRSDTRIGGDARGGVSLGKRPRDAERQRSDQRKPEK